MTLRCAATRVDHLTYFVDVLWVRSISAAPTLNKETQNRNATNQPR